MKEAPSGPDQFAEAHLVPDSRGPYVAPPPPGSGPNLHDLLFVLFRHKWKIILLGLLGLGGAAVVYSQRVPLFESHAKLFIPYVVDSNIAGANGTQVSSAAGYAGRSVLNVQIDLLTSWDLLEKVADGVGPANVVSGTDGEPTTSEAAAAIMAGLKVVVPPDSMVIHATFQHQEPDKARTILQRLVSEYLIKHKETYRSSRSLSAVDTKKSETGVLLDAARKELEDLKKTQNIISLDNRESALAKQQAAIEDELLATESKKAEQIVRVRFAEAMVPAASSKKPGDGAGEVTVRAALPATRDIEEYQSLVAMVETLKRRLNELRLTYTESNSQIQTIKSRLAETDNKRQALIEQFPVLGVSLAKTVEGGLPPPINPRAEQETLDAIEARLQFLNSESARLKGELTNLLEVGNKIEKLERDIQEHDANFRYYSSALDRATVDANLKPSELENITVIQKPSMAAQMTSPKVKKLAMGLALSGFGLGIALALLIEFFLDRSIKRPQEFESRLQLPLMLSIPFLTSPRRPQLRLNGPEDGSGAGGGEASSSKALARHLNGNPTPWQPSHFIRPFADAIRDRIGYHFHINGITHKPKLIGLTGFSEGAGTSTLAASLAASFAEMTEGKILYVNLNGGTPLPPHDAGAGSPPRSGIDVTASSKETFGLVEQRDNLFVATITPGKNRNLTTDTEGHTSYQTFIPKQLYELMPRLRASDFEYVIFDMPPLAPTSPTLAIAGFMDKMLLVVDAGKTNRDIVRRSYHELTGKANADVSTILNKTRESLPSWLQG